MNTLDTGPHEGLYTEAEATKMLKNRALQRIRLRDEIEFYRIGGQVRYSLQQIKNYLVRCLRFVRGK